MEEFKSFSQRLKEALASRKINQSELALRIGVSRSIVSEYMSGKFIPKQDRIIKIAEALDVSAEFLLGLSKHLEPKLSLLTTFGLREYRASSSIESVNIYFYLKYHLINKRVGIDHLLTEYYQYLISTDLYAHNINLSYTLSLTNVVNHFKNYFIKSGLNRIDIDDVNSLSIFLDRPLRVDDNECRYIKSLDSDLSLQELDAIFKRDLILNNDKMHLLIEYERDIYVLLCLDKISKERFENSLRSVLKLQEAINPDAVKYFESNFSDFLNNKLTYVVDMKYKVMTFTVPLYDRIPSDLRINKNYKRIRDLEVPSEIASYSDLFGYKFTSENLNKVIPKNVIVVIDMNDNIYENDICAVSIDGKDAILAKYHRFSDRVIFENLSFIDGFEPITIKKDEKSMQIIGRVIWFCSDLDN